MIDVGAATSSVNFFRSMGGSIGVALYGALFNAGLGDRLGGMEVSVGEASSFTPQALRDLPPDQLSDVVSAFSDSLTGVFLYSVPLIVVAFLIVLAMRETPLRHTVHDVAEHPTRRPAPDHGADHHPLAS